MAPRPAQHRELLDTADDHAIVNKMAELLSDLDEIATVRVYDSAEDSLTWQSAEPPSTPLALVSFYTPDGSLLRVLRVRPDAALRACTESPSLTTNLEPRAKALAAQERVRLKAEEDRRNVEIEASISPLAIRMQAPKIEQSSTWIKQGLWGGGYWRTETRVTLQPAHLGDSTRALSEPELYRQLGRADIAHAYERNRRARIGLLVGGSLSAFIGIATLLATLVGNSEYKVSRSVNIAMLSIGGPMLGIGAVGIAVGALLPTHRLEPDVVYDMVVAHNHALWQKAQSQDGR